MLQDVFVRAYGALRNDDREMNVRAWLYRVAHNRCIDHLRRPIPPAAELFEVSRKPLHDPVEEAQRRDDLRQLVDDVGRLPEQQRSALLMREIDGMTYADLADALDVTVPAVKSLLVRARVGLVEAAEARDADCSEIRDDLLRAYDRGVKASGRARRHMRSCDGCREYRTALRGVQRSFAALTPVGFGPLALLAKLARPRRRRRRAAAQRSVAAAPRSAAGSRPRTACKVAAVVCTAALARAAPSRSTTRSSEQGARAPAQRRPHPRATRPRPPRRRSGSAGSRTRRRSRWRRPTVIHTADGAGRRAAARRATCTTDRQARPTAPPQTDRARDRQARGLGDARAADDDPQAATGGARALRADRRTDADRPRRTTERPGAARPRPGARARRRRAARHRADRPGGARRRRRRRRHPSAPPRRLGVASRSAARD